MDRIQNLRLEPWFHFFSLYAPDLLQIMIHCDVVREYKFCEVQVGVSQGILIVPPISVKISKSCMLKLIIIKKLTQKQTRVNYDVIYDTIISILHTKLVNFRHTKV